MMSASKGRGKGILEIHQTQSAESTIVGKGVGHTENVSQGLNLLFHIGLMFTVNIWLCQLFCSIQKVNFDYHEGLC